MRNHISPRTIGQLTKTERRNEAKSGDMVEEKPHLERERDMVEGDEDDKLIEDISRPCGKIQKNWVDL